MASSPWVDSSSSIEALPGSGIPSCQIPVPPPQLQERMPGDWPGSELFLHTNFKTRFSRRLSASIFLSSVFSRSSSFSLLASLTSIWPNCFFHRWKLTCERLCSRHTSPMLWPASACLNIRIFSSVLYLFPFILFGLGCPKD